MVLGSPQGSLLIAKWSSQVDEYQQQLTLQVGFGEQLGGKRAKERDQLESATADSKIQMHAGGLG